MRRPEFSRNPDLERLLDALSAAIAPGGDALAAAHPRPRLPVLLVVGAPRSGSTLLMQWLAASGAFTVPTNLVSRFHRAPALGAMVERLLFDPAVDFRGELRLPDAPPDYRSDLGKTRGLRAPNELWYFWRRHLGVTDAPGPDDLRELDTTALLGELGAWESVWGRPLAMKALIAAWVLPWLAARLPGAVFIDLARDPFFNAQSLLQARVRFHGDERAWYGFRVPGLVPPADPLAQVAAQVTETRRAIDAGLAALPPSRVLRVRYERLCADPAATWAALAALLAPRGLSLPDPPPARFASADRVRLPPDRAAALRVALAARSTR